MKRYLGAIFVLFFALTTAMACSEQGASQEQAAVKQEVQRQADSEQQAAAMSAGRQPVAETPAVQAAAADEEIQGTVVKTDEGIVIFSDRGSYMVAGHDLEGLVGKNVKITGTVEETEGRSVVTVSSVAVIE